MSERTNITNLLLLAVLTGVLLVSGSLQCAFDCLTQANSLHTPLSLHVQTDRTDTCHPAIEHVAPTSSCLNKACHQRLPLHSKLGGPVIYQLEKLAQPLYSNSRQPVPQYRAGSAILISPLNLQPVAWLQATVSKTTTQTLHSIRSTVILC